MNVAQIKSVDSAKAKGLVASFKKEGRSYSTSFGYVHQDGTEIAVAMRKHPDPKKECLDIAFVKGNEYLRISTSGKDNECVVSLNELDKGSKQSISFSVEDKDITNSEGLIEKLPNRELKDMMETYVGKNIDALAMHVHNRTRSSNRDFTNAVSAFMQKKSMGK